MEITDKIRDQILIAMPVLSQTDADKIATIEGCSSMTVYNHWKKLKQLKKGDTLTATPIMIAISVLAISYKKKSDKDHKRFSKITRQLSAA